MNKKIEFYILLLISLITFIIAAGGVPAVGAGDKPISATDITIGHTIEALISDTILTDLKDAFPSENMGELAKSLFTALFLIDFMMCIATAYMQGNYNSLIPTVCIKSFFFIAVTTAFQPARSGLPFVFAIPQELVAQAVKLDESGLSWAWFSDSTSKFAVDLVTRNGLLTQLDSMVTNVSNSLIDNPGFLLSGVFLVWAVFMLMAFRLLYFQIIKLVFGLLIKAFEWAIGLPIAFFMLAGKGHPQGEEYFNLGMQYIFYVALDFAVLMGMFTFGYQLVDDISKTMSADGSIAATFMGVLKLIFTIVFWLGAVLNVESIVAGIAGGAPAFTNNMGNSLLAIGNAVTSASGIAAPIKAISNGVNNKLNGGGFFEGVATSLKESLIGGVIGGVKDQFRGDLTQGYTSKKSKYTHVDPITGTESEKEYDEIGNSNSALGNVKENMNNWSRERTKKKNSYSKFFTETGISKSEMIKMGLITEHSREQFMKNHSTFDDLHKKLEKLGINSYATNSKTGNKSIQNIQTLKTLLSEAELESKTKLNSKSQKAYSSNSEMTKNMKKHLTSVSSSPDAQINLVKDWMKEGSKNMQEFSVQDFRDSVRSIGQNIVKNKDPKTLKKYQKVLETQFNTYQKMADNNELFDHIEDVDLRAEANKNFKMHLSFANTHVQGLKIS